MDNTQNSRDRFPYNWSSVNLLKLGAVAMIAGSLFEVNSAVHFSENTFSMDGVEAFALGAISFRLGARALIEAHHRNQAGADSFSEYNNDEF